MTKKLYPLEGRQVVISDEELLRRRAENKRYMMSLTNANLLRNHTFEAGMVVDMNLDASLNHGGWESPICQLRGHFLGHWLSAAAMAYKATGDMELKAKADAIVDTLGECQTANGGEWVGSIPEKYLTWIAEGRAIWAPQYTLHKTIMGLLDIYEMAGNKKALDITINFAKWFSRWSEEFSREEFDNILDVETGGMLETWVQLYAITKAPEHKALVDKYYRARLFEPLLQGKEIATNMHANTTIPEVLGAARAYEVTGEQKWLDIVIAYWDTVVTQRGQYATGSQTCGEIWSPKQELSLRLGDKNQEHCVVYNMMRLADFLMQQTGEARFADYWEQNLYNGIMAQGYWQGSFTHARKSEYPEKGLLTYYLPLRAGATKAWSSETNDFFCCHGTLVQANAALNNGIYYSSEHGVTVCQYLDSRLSSEFNGTKFTLSQKMDTLTRSDHTSSTSAGKQEINDTAWKYPHDPMRLAVKFTVAVESPCEFELNFRVPWWIMGDVTVLINGENQAVNSTESSFITLKRLWNNDEIYMEFPKGITVYPLPGEDNTVAFMDGPVVLAGLCDEERTLYVDMENPAASIVCDNEREWAVWQHTFKVKDQDRGIRFIPLNRVGYEPYTVYFPLKQKL